MSRTRGIMKSGLAALSLVAACATRSMAQGPTVGGDSYLNSPGGNSSTLGATPGAGGGALGGQQGQVLGGRPGASVPRVPTSVSTPSGIGLPSDVTSTLGAGPITSSVPTAVFGALAIPQVVDDLGPADGLTLDDAIDRYVRDNINLRVQWLEIPQAQADILTQSLRANPIFYADSQLVPYGQYSNARPGGQTQYDVNISYPLDLTRKRRARTISAERAKAVLEAQYQDAVRQGVDAVYGAFVTVLQARGAVRFSQKGVDGYKDVVTSTKALVDKGEKTQADLQRARIQLNAAIIGLRNNEAAYLQAKRALGLLLKLTPAESEKLEVRGSLRDTFAAPPTDEELTATALRIRPDVVSFRLGVSRAEADVKLAKANILPDVYLLYQPYTLQDNTYQGLKSPTSWAVGVTIPIPIYNRNQGVIQRARHNVTQTQLQLAATEQQAIADVRQAQQTYTVTLGAVKDFEKDVLPEADYVLADSKRRYEKGEDDLITYLGAIKDYNDIAKQYLDALVAHRNSMLDLNTAVGQRILP